MNSKPFTSNKTGMKVDIISEYGIEITVEHLGKEIGSISLSEKDDYDYHFHITNLSLDGCKFQGIGRACLQYHKRVV